MELTNFLGYTIAQTKEAIPFWESLVKNNKPLRIIELGSGNGMFSCYLKMLCIQLGAEFYTFDHHLFIETPISVLIDLRSSFEILDIFGNEEKIANLVKKDGLTILFCDDGNKIQEFSIFVKYLKIGDIICAHDWGDEIKDEDVSEVIYVNNLDHLQLDEYLENKAYTKFFMKRS